MIFLKSLLGILMLYSISCVSNSGGGVFLKDDVSFSYPPDWHITEQEDLDGNGYYLSIEKEGINESGLVTITWINGYIDSHEYLAMIQEGFEEQKLLNDLEFKPSQNNTYNGIQSISCDYYFNTLGIRHKGVIYVFSIGDKTFSVTTQEALEDISKNKLGFELIEASFKIK